MERGVLRGRIALEIGGVELDVLLVNWKVESHLSTGR